MRAEGEHGAIALAGTTADYVADRIGHDIREAVGAHEFSHAPGADFLMERRRFDLAKLNLLLHGAVDLAGGLLHGSLYFRLLRKLLHLSEHFFRKGRNVLSH